MSLVFDRLLEELSEKEISKAVIDVIKERRRQMAVEGWTIEHDDQHLQSELAWAAACYAIGGAHVNPAAIVISQKDIPHALWPWALQWFKPTDRRRDLEKAGALIIAEIERLDRADAALPCPICEAAFYPDDICATDIELGICHAECLEGSPVVDLDTGEPIPDGKLDTYRFADTDPPGARGDVATIRDALRDPTIASYPDFTKAVSDALDELERLRAQASEASR